MIARRIVRTRVNRTSQLTGEPESYVGTVQTTSLYSLHPPGPWADDLERPAGRRAPFPTKRQLSLLEALSLSWKQSSRGQGETQSHQIKKGVFHPGYYQQRNRKRSQKAR